MTWLQNNRIQNAGGKGSHRQFLLNFYSRRQLLLKLILFLLLFAGILQEAKSFEVDTVWMRQTWPITSISFHPNSEIIAVGNEGKYIGIWDVKTGTEIQKYKQGTIPWTCFFSNSGKYIVYGGNWGYFIRNFDTDSLIFSYTSPAVVALSKDERYFATAYNNNSISIWDLQTGEKIKQLDSIIKINVPESSVSFIEFSPDGSHIACGTYYSKPNSDDRLVLINLADMKIDYNCRIGDWCYFKYSNDGTKIAYTSPDSGEAIKIMDVKTKQIIATIPGFPQGVGEIVFSSDDKYLLFTYSEEIKVWDIVLNKLNKSFYFEPRFLFAPSCDFSINQKYIAGTSGGYLLLFNFNGSANIIENNMISATLVYPNPSDNNLLNLTFSLIKSNQTEINIFSLNGQTIKGIENKYLFEGSHSYSVNTSDLPNGSYFLKINSGNYAFSQSFIINR